MKNGMTTFAASCFFGTLLVACVKFKDFYGGNG
jgi:hypothetical protein